MHALPLQVQHPCQAGHPRHGQQGDIQGSQHISQLAPQPRDPGQQHGGKLLLHLIHGASGQAGEHLQV